MDYAFNELVERIMVIYLDDLISFTKVVDDHIKHLKTVFERCYKFSIYLNLKKSNFGLIKGKLLGHVVSKQGACIDPKRLKEIH